VRKPLLVFVGLILFLSTACNLPARYLPGASTSSSWEPAQLTPVLFTPVKLPQATPLPPTQTALAQPSPLPPTAGPQATARPSPARPTPSPLPPTPSATLSYDPTRYTAYLTQSGDTLKAVAARFGVSPQAILPPQVQPAGALIPIHQTLFIPRGHDPLPDARFALPDSALVNSPCGRAFNLADFIHSAGGLLSSYTQEVTGRRLTGSEIVRRVVDETSVSPQVLLAFIEYRSHWLLSTPAQPNWNYPLGFTIGGNEGLYPELSIAANLLNLGYYPWREGQMTTLTFFDNRSARIAPQLNAGSVAVQYLFARMLSQAEWEAAVYGPQGFLDTYQSLFGDPQVCAKSVEPLIPDGLTPPNLELPFAPDEPWALTGGLHNTWTIGTPAGALDFAPIKGEMPCAVSRAWVLASAAGVITRAENGQVLLALLDASGHPSGWEVLYMHIAQQDRIAVGTQVRVDEHIGHPSCEGGLATGTHVHIARLYRGEWVGAGEALPLCLSGWLSVPGAKPYQSTLVLGSRVIESDINGSAKSQVLR
jgi:murein DD-endopeptidase MepM/ murein hydrolase activator NlpD